MDTAGVDPDGVVRLVGAILRGTPNLARRGLPGRHELFDDVAWETRPSARRDDSR